MFTCSHVQLLFMNGIYHTQTLCLIALSGQARQCLGQLTLFALDVELSDRAVQASIIFDGFS